MNVSDKLFVPLKKTLLLRVLLTSALVTTIVTGLSFYMEYKREMSILQNNLAYITKSFKASIVQSLWTLDQEQTKTQLSGILASPDFVEVSISDAEGKIIFNQRKNVEDFESLFTENLPLHYAQGRHSVDLGKLHITVSKHLIYQRLWQKVIDLVVTQALKVFVISFLLLHLFSALVTNHILAISRFLANYDWRLDDEQQVLKLNTGRQTYNELDQLQESINRSIALVKENFDDAKAARSKAVAAAQRERHFVASMSHELRTPLNAVLGMIDMLKETPLSSDAVRFVEVQERAGKVLLSLVNQVLDFSKIEAGQCNLEQISFDMQGVLDSVRSLVESSAQKQGMILEVISDEHSRGFFLGDPNKIRQILINIINNAIKYSKGSRIKLLVQAQARSSQDYSFLIKIVDDGVGIAESDLKNIFKPFFQAEESQSSKVEGTGLGLAISQQLIKLMDGGISVESKVNEGTQFMLRFNLPHVLTPGVVSKLDKQRNPSSRKLPYLKVLAVDDNADNLYILSMYLRKSNVQLSQAKNGEEAVKLVQNHQFDLILMDKMMPVMDGYLATKSIRAWESEHKKSRAVIVALTAANTKDDILEARRVGFDAHIAKPISKKRLLEIIDQYFSDMPNKEAS